MYQAKVVAYCSLMSLANYQIEEKPCKFLSPQAFKSPHIPGYLTLMYVQIQLRKERKRRAFFVQHCKVNRAL